MKTTGIIMSGDHPKLILEGLKTMTRRVITPQPQGSYTLSFGSVFEWQATFLSRGELILKCPYGGVGDRLWVRETWAVNSLWDDRKPSQIPSSSGMAGQKQLVWYSDRPKLDYQGKTRPSLFMPRWASRITLEITEVRVERLQEITESDAKAEGADCCPNAVSDYRHHFMVLWDSRNAKRGYGWDKNPWVWVISFKVVKND
jgi:hypothetical protein